MEHIIFHTAYSKCLLRNLLKMKPTTFKEWMKTLEPDVLLIDKHYSKYSSLLTPKVFRFLLYEYGFEDAVEINKMIREYYGKTGINED